VTTTQLFAELVVIGIGAGLWLSLFGAAVLHHRIDQGLPRPESAVLVAFVGIAYVLGIVIDRLAYSLLKPVEKAEARRILAAAGLPDGPTVERYVLVRSTALGKQIQYNRSRLRICRAWVLNAVLISLGLIAWNPRISHLALGPYVFLLVLGILASLLLGWTTWNLSQDHYNNLRDSYLFLQKKGAEKSG
jgi:hypothetical protein